MRSERTASAFSQGFAFFSNAEIRRQRGGARVRFAPSGRKGRSRVRPVLADSAPGEGYPFRFQIHFYQRDASPMIAVEDICIYQFGAGS